MIDKYKHKKIKAFTMAEVMLTMLILGIIISMTISNAVKQAPNLTKAKFKKAYVNVETAISQMVNNADLYSGGLDDTRLVRTEFGDRFEGESKFRTAFFYYIDVLEEDMELMTFKDKGFSAQGDICARSKEGIIYCIPDTDFGDTGTFELKTKRQISDKTAPIEIVSKYVPITIYPNLDQKKVEGAYDPMESAAIIGVRSDGKIIVPDKDTFTVFQKLDCSDSDKNKLMCNIHSYLTDDTLRDTRRD